MVMSRTSFCRMMRKHDRGMKNVEHYVDDILVYTKTLEENLEVIKHARFRFREVKLTARPTKW